MSRKVYLGDGVFVEHVPELGHLNLTTEDGISNNEQNHPRPGCFEKFHQGSRIDYRMEDGTEGLMHRAKPSYDELEAMLSTALATITETRETLNKSLENTERALALLDDAENLRKAILHECKRLMEIAEKHPTSVSLMAQLLKSIRADASAYQWHTAIDNTLNLTG